MGPADFLASMIIFVFGAALILAVLILAPAYFFDIFSKIVGMVKRKKSHGDSIQDILDHADKEIESRQKELDSIRKSSR